MEKMELEWLETWEAISTGTRAAGQPKNEKEYNKFWLKRYETKVEKGFLDCANALMEIKENKLYKDSYSTWKDYLKKRWGYSSEWWQKLQQSAVVIHNLESSTNGTVLPSNERQARELAPLEPPQQVQVWKEVTDRYDPTEITAEKIKKVKQEILEPEVEVIEFLSEGKTCSENILNSFNDLRKQCKKNHPITSGSGYNQKDLDELKSSFEFISDWANTVINNFTIKNNE